MAAKQPLKIGLPIHYHNLDYVNFSKKDIKNSVNSNLRLYRVNSIYYYRRTINKKTYRISLKTTDLQKAKLLKNEFNLLKNEEFAQMAENPKSFDPELDNYYYKKMKRIEALKVELEVFQMSLSMMTVFKTEEERKEIVKAFALKQIQQFQDIFLDNNPYKDSNIDDIKKMNFDEVVKQFETLASTLTQQEQHETKEPLTFQQLQDLFLTHKEKMGKVGVSSIKMYKAAFKDLMEYFQDANINELKYQDFENFQNFLIAKKLNNKTINNKITYLRMFLDYAEKFELVEKNLANKLEMLKEEVKEKENFTNDEVNLLIKNAPQEFKNFLQVAMYTGMRLQEILAIDKILVDEKTQIKYIQVGDSKTTSGIRKVPLHQEILNMKFPLFNIKDGDVRTFSTNIGKRINRYIETIAKEKTIHIFRATFINKIVNNFPERIEICQEIVGHSKGNKSITLNTYSKEFDIKLKQEIVNTVQYK